MPSKIAGSDRDCLAYARRCGGRATCFVYFQDNLWGAVALHNFASDVAPRRGHPPQLRIVEQDLTLNHPAILELFHQSSGAADSTEHQPPR